MGTWSKAKPSEEGFYWYRNRNGVARVCHVDSRGYVSFTDGVVREVGRLRGEWSAIEYPSEDHWGEGQHPRYTVRRCNREGFIYGSHHGSVNGSETLCGLVLGGGYYITHNEFDGPVTCRKCMGVIRGQA